jgi:hypothetical protein
MTENFIVAMVMGFPHRLFAAAWAAHLLESYLSMILSENRYPLFGIMLYLAIFRRAGLGWLGADS